MTGNRFYNQLTYGELIVWYSSRRPCVRVSVLSHFQRSFLVKTENEKRRFVVKVQAFCEEKGLRSFLRVFGYAESEN